jgi:hypothetical protein
MIIDKSNGRLIKIKSYSYDFGMENSFNEVFGQLEKYSEKGYDVVIYKALHPLSLTFELFYDEEKIVDGKIIFHGTFPHNVISPFSVSIGENKKIGWFIDA